LSNYARVADMLAIGAWLNSDIRWTWFSSTILVDGHDRKKPVEIHLLSPHTSGIIYVAGRKRIEFLGGLSEV